MLVEKAKNKFKDSNTSLLFFFDPEKEYGEEVASYRGEEFLVLIVNENYFKIKHQVEIEYKGKNILLYHTFEKPTAKEYQQYPLVDLLLANPELIIDEISDIIDQYGIHHKHAPVLLKFKKWVNAKKYAAKLLPILEGKNFNENEFLNAIVSLILNEKKIGNPTFNLISVLIAANEGLDNWEKTKSLLIKNNLSDFFLEEASKITGTEIPNLEYTAIRSLLLKLKYNIITEAWSEADEHDPYSKLKDQTEIGRTKINVFFKEWQDDKIKSSFLNDVLEKLGSNVEAKRIVNIYGIQKEYGLKTTEVFQTILQKYIPVAIPSPEVVLEKFAAWKNNLHEYSDYQDELEFLVNTSKYFKLLRSYKDFDFDFLDDYIINYQSELQKLDTYYRHAFTAYQKLQREESSIDFTEIFKELNKSYDQFLIDLNTAWMKILTENSFDYSKIKVRKQFNFYKDFVAGSSTKKVVIISDGFRYELATDLLDHLKSDANNKLKLTPIVASIPSYTNLGMSNLLPNDGIEALISENTIDYTINGIKTSSQHRDKILKSFSAQSATVGYAVFMKWPIDKQKEFLKENRIVYIYHNWMDTIGDTKSSEYGTFEIVEQCVSQLTVLIKRLYQSLNSYNVVVTADHGFLFNYEEIQESSRQPFPDLKSTLKEHTRFSLCLDQKKYPDTSLFPLNNTTNIKSDVQVVLPKNINRFKKLGNFGVQFVHGGSSLQEVIVPVLEINWMRNNKASNVEYKRIDTLKSMATSTATFKIFQKEAVSELYKPTSLLVALYDIDGNMISNEINVLLKSTSTDPTDRVFDFKLELNALGSVTKNAYLRAFSDDDTDKLNSLFINDLIKINTLTEIDQF